MTLGAAQAAACPIPAAVSVCAALSTGHAAAHMHVASEYSCMLQGQQHCVTRSDLTCAEPHFLGLIVRYDSPNTSQRVPGAGQRAHPGVSFGERAAACCSRWLGSVSAWMALTVASGGMRAVSRERWPAVNRARVAFAVSAASRPLWPPARHCAPQEHHTQAQTQAHAPGAATIYN